MQTSNGIDINYSWYLNRQLASAGSLVGKEAGSVYVIDLALDFTTSDPYLNLWARASPDGEKQKGKGIKNILGDEHYVSLFQPGSPSI